MALNGVEFNAKYTGVNFYKLTNATNKHYKMTYVDGENIDINKLLVDDNKTGLYFFETQKAFIHIADKYTHIRKVTIPDDAIVVIRESSFRTNKFILGPSKELGKELDLMYEFIVACKYISTKDFYRQLLKYEPNKQNKYEILGRLATYGMSFIDEAFISDNDICHIVDKYPKIINVCPNVSNEMYIRALTLDGMVLQTVSNKFKSFMTIIKGNRLFANETDTQLKFDKFAEIAVRQNFVAIQFVDSPNDKLCKIAFEQSKDADKYIPKVSKDVATFVISLYPEFSRMKKYSIGIDEQSALELITKDPNYIDVIPLDIQTEEMCKMALNADIKNFKHIDEKFYYLVSTVF